MKHRFGIWALLWRSPWSADAYRDVAAGGVGRIFGYLALLIAIVALITSVRVHTAVSGFAQSFRELKPWEANLPEIQIREGRATTLPARPYVFQNEDVMIVIDTTGETTELDPQYREGFLLTETELILRMGPGPGETRRLPFAGVPDLTLNQTTVERAIQIISPWTWLGVAVAMTIWLWIVKLMQVLVWTPVSMVVNAVSRRALRYGALWNLGIYALTVHTVFDLFKDSVGRQSWALVLFSLALYSGYLIWAVLVQPVPPAGRRVEPQGA